MNKKLLIVLILIFLCPLFASAKYVSPKNNLQNSSAGILYLDKNNNGKLDLNETLIVISAYDYTKIFNRRPPLNRTLRAQIDKKAYVALNETDFKKLDTNKDSVINSKDSHFYKIYFVKVSSDIQGAYIFTEAKRVHYSDLEQIVLKPGKHEHEAIFQKGEKRTVRASKKSIPSVGL